MATYNDCSVVAIHWGEDVPEFKPERFIDTESYRWPREACESYTLCHTSLFLLSHLKHPLVNAFASGPRSCIGQRFAVTESVCILAHIVRRYEILVPEDLDSKTPAEQRKSLLQWTPGITITPRNARVRLRLRGMTE
jgi:cytochrome P450